MSSDAKNSNVIPNVQTYGFTEGASSPRENAFMVQQQTAAKQNEINQQHGGYTYTRTKSRTRRRRRIGGSGNRIIVPQASTGGMTQAGPNDGNSAATQAAQHLTQSNANAEFDNQVGKSGTVTQVAGGKRRSRKYKKRISQKGCASKRKHVKYTAKNFRKHYMWNTKGKRYMAKTYKQHMKGVKLGHTHSKPKKRTIKRKSKKGGKRRRKGGYPFQKWGCFS